MSMGTDDEKAALAIAEELLKLMPDSDDEMDDDTYSNILSKAKDLEKYSGLK